MKSSLGKLHFFKRKIIIDESYTKLNQIIIYIKEKESYQFKLDPKNK